MEKDEKQTNNGAKEEKNDVFFISNVLTYIGRQTSDEEGFFYKMKK